MRFLLAAALIVAACPAAQAQDDAKLQKDVDALCAAVGKTLGVPFKKNVAAAYQSREDFAVFVRKNIEDEMPAEKREAVTLMYKLLKLVPEDFDLLKVMTDLVKTQAGAYYDPEQKKIFVLAGNLPADQMSMTLFHELVHAIQDQEHDLGPTMKKLGAANNDDVATAYRFLAEGEASFWMTVYMMEQRTGLAWKDVPKLAKVGLGMTKNTTSKFIKEMSKQTDDPAMKEAAEALQNVPPILVRTLVDPYMRGLYSSSKIYDRDGAGGFRDMFAKAPPTNTRDMMFADDWMKKPDRGQVKVTLSKAGEGLGAGWKRVHEDTLGAITFHTMFEDQLKTADKIAKGWDGDRCETWKHEGGGAVVLVKAVLNEDETAALLAAELEGHYKDNQRSVIRQDGKKVIFALGQLPKDTAVLLAAIAKP